MMNCLLAPLRHVSRMRKRIPRSMSIVIFRTATARAQTFVAERLQEEGWFDGDGFLLTKWFGDEPVEILSVHGSHGERMQVRAAPRRAQVTA